MLNDAGFHAGLVSGNVLLDAHAGLFSGNGDMFGLCTSTSSIFGSCFITNCLLLVEISTVVFIVVSGLLLSGALPSLTSRKFRVTDVLLQADPRRHGKLTALEDAMFLLDVHEGFFVEVGN